MSTLQVRNVPDAVHRRLKARSAAAGQSLSEYLLAHLTEVAERPTLAELTERIDQLGRIPVTADSVDVLAAERGARP